MSRSRTAFLSGTITDNPLTNVATTLNSAALASLPAIASPDIAVLVLDPTGSAGAPEVVYVTAHTGSATSATISRAQEGSAARQHASGIAWVHGPTLYDFKGWRLEGENTTEQTTTSTSAVDLVTISSLLIPVTQFIEITFVARKSSGAAAYAGIGLKVNSTVVAEASSGGSGGQVMTFSNSNQAETGICTIWIAPRSTNYLKSATSRYTTYTASGGLSQSNGYPAATADFPNATITSIALRGISGSASVTLAIKEVQVMVRDA